MTRELHLMRWSELERAALEAGVPLKTIQRARSLAELRQVVGEAREAVRRA